MNKITQVSEASLRRLNRYLPPYTFLQLTLLTSFAGSSGSCAQITSLLHLKNFLFTSKEQALTLC